MDQELIPYNVLGELFKMQKELLAHYISIEGLPEYPLNLTLKKSQKLIKDFLGRFIEELSEAFEFLLLAHSAIEKNRVEEAKGHIREYNMEMGDALHFLIEFLLYANLDSHKLEMKLFSFLKDFGTENLYILNRPLKSLFDFNWLNNGTDLVKYKHSSSLFNIFLEQEEIHLASKKLSWPLIEEHAKSLWMVVHEFNKATNYLKNRDWHQTEKELNLLGFENAVLRGLIAFVYYLELSGYRESIVYMNYLKANQKNHARIRGKY